MIDDEWRPEAPLGGAGSDFACYELPRQAKHGGLGKSII